jgi:putative hydrolase of HD superfamily
MQPIDQEDPRPPYLKVAASIRAAILSGELAPDIALPAARDLARTFSVGRGVIGGAVRELVNEGYVRSVKGGRVYVRGRATMPQPTGEDHPLTGAAAFLYEIGTAKTLPRAGWLRLGIKSPESVADHSFRVGIVGMVLAAMEGVDVGRVAALCLMHDAHEVRIGDLSVIARAYVEPPAPQAVTAHQTGAMPDDVAAVLLGLTDEYEADARTAETLVARDADKIDTLLQAREYATHGYPTDDFVETSINALRTDAGKELARAIMATDPHLWWKSFAASYAALRKRRDASAQVATKRAYLEETLEASGSAS